MAKAKHINGQKTIFMNLPAPGGDNRYVAIDVRALKPYHLKSFYTPIRAAGGVPEYVPDPGFADRFYMSVDTQIVTKEIDERFSELDFIVSEISPDLLDGVTGDKVKQQFAALVDHLANGRLNLAVDAVNALLYSQQGIFGHILNLVQGLRRQIANTEGVAAAQEMRADILQQAIAGEAELTLEVHMNWAQAARNLVNAFNNLSALEQRLHARVSKLGSLLSSLHSATGDDRSEYRTLLEALVDGDDAFNVAAFMHLRKPEAPSPSHESISNASKAIGVCKRLAERAMLIWQELITAGPELGAVSEEVNRIAGLYEESWREFADYTRRFGRQVAPTQTLDESYITQQEFDQALQLSATLEQSPTSIRLRLVELTQAGLIYATTAPPTFPPAVKAALEQAEGYLLQLDAKEVKSQSVPVVPVVVHTSSMPVAEAKPTAENPPRAAVVSLSDARIREIYQLVVCVGFALTYHGKLANMKQTNKSTKNMLEILMEAKLVTYPEKEAIKAELWKKMKAESTHMGELDFQSKWLSEHKTDWIYYKAPRKKGAEGYKLTNAGAQKAKIWLESLGVTLEQIQEAKETWSSRRKVAPMKYKQYYITQT